MRLPIRRNETLVETNLNEPGDRGPVWIERPIPFRADDFHGALKALAAIDECLFFFAMSVMFESAQELVLSVLEFWRSQHVKSRDDSLGMN